MTLIELLAPLLPFSLGFAAGFSVTIGQALSLRISTGLLAGIVTVTLFFRSLQWVCPDDDQFHRPPE